MKKAKNEPGGVTLTLPLWLEKILAGPELVLPTPEERMRWVIGLSRRNVENKSGGPFAAAVFASPGGKLIAAGVNRVEPLNCSAAHAEIMAFAFAQRKMKTFDLGANAGIATELVTSSQPCLMCLGATLWSGVTQLTYGAAAGDVTSILGFDEGPLPGEWPLELKRRGIALVARFLRSEAVVVLEQYKKNAGTIYNSRQGS